MNYSHQIHLTPARVKGKYCIRFVANQEKITTAQIDNAWKMIQDFAAQTLEKTTRRAFSDPKKFQRYSMTRIVSKEDYEKITTR